MSSPHQFHDHTNIGLELIIVALTLLAFLPLMFFYSSLPERIPEYLNLNGDVAVWGRKNVFSIFRLPLMALDLQMVCVLMKYGMWQGSQNRNVEEREPSATYRKDLIKFSLNLWDWFRAFIAIKLGASSIEIIFYSIERFHSLTILTRITSWAASVLGIAGAAFYSYRLLAVNRKLKEVDGNSGIPRARSRQNSPGIFYYNPDDPSWFSDRYSPNFANKWLYLFLACLLCLPVLMFLPMLST